MLPPPMRTEARSEAMRIRRRSGRSAVALALLLVLASVLACTPSDPLETAREQIASGRAGEAVESLRGLLSTRRDDPELLLLYGTALLQIGEPTLATWPLRRAMDHPDYTVAAGKQLASGEYRSGNHAATVETLDRVLEVAPDDIEALSLRATALAAGRQRYEESLRDTDRVLELDPDNLAILKPRVVALLGLERIDEAGELLEQLQEVDPITGLGPDPTSCAGQALFLEATDEEDAAEARFFECLDAYPRSALLVRQALQFLDERGKYEASLEVLHDALEALPGARAYRTGIAARLRLLGRSDEALELLMEATESEAPEQAVEAWLDVADHYLQTGRLEQAADAVERAYRGTDRPSPELLFVYADALILTGRYDAVPEVVEQMTLPAHRAFARGRLAMETGRLEEALAHFEEGAEHWPNNPAVRYLAARAAEQLGDVDRAIAEYRQSIRSGGEQQTDARVRLARLHIAQGQIDEARIVATMDGRITSPDDPDLSVLEGRALAGGLQPVLQPLRQVPAENGLRALGLAAAVRGLGRADRALADDVWSLTGLQPRHPANAPALEAVLEHRIAQGELEEAVALTAAAAEALPDFAPFHALHARALAAAGAPVADVRAALDRALAIDAELPLALEVRSRLALAAGDAEGAVATLEPLVARMPERIEAWRTLARAYGALERPDDERRALEALLAERPDDVPAALALIDLDLAESRVDERTLARASAAVRFRGGEPARERRQRVRERLGDAS